MNTFRENNRNQELRVEGRVSDYQDCGGLAVKELPF